MIEYEDLDPVQPGDVEDAWADYQYTSAERDLVEAMTELGQGNLGNAWTLAKRAHRYARIAVKNRQEAARLRIVALVSVDFTDEAVCADPN